MEGQVKFWSSEKRFGLIDGNDGERYMTIAHEVVADDIGRQFLARHERVSFQPDIGRNGRPFANGVIVLDRECPDLSDHHEECVVYSWNNAYGFAHRPDGSSIIVHKSEIITEGGLRPGSHLWCRIAPPLGGNAWRAVEVEICID